MSQLHDLAAVRDLLLDALLSVTPADRAAVLIDNAVWECQAGETEARMSERTDAVDRIFMSGESFLSEMMAHMRPARESKPAGRVVRRNIEIRKTVRPRRLALLQGTGRVAA